MVKNLPANAGDAGSIPGLGRSPGGGNGNPLQYSCLKNPMDRGDWSIGSSDMTEQVHTHTAHRSQKSVLKPVRFPFSELG